LKKEKADSTKLHYGLKAWLLNYARSVFTELSENGEDSRGIFHRPGGRSSAGRGGVSPTYKTIAPVGQKQPNRGTVEWLQAAIPGSCKPSCGTRLPFSMTFEGQPGGPGPIAGLEGGIGRANPRRHGRSSIRKAARHMGRRKNAHEKAKFKCK